MFAAVVVGVFVLMIFSAELFKIWRRETEYRRARALWDDDGEELRARAWKGPGPGQRPAGAPGYLTAPATPRPATTPIADIQMRIKQELHAMHQDVQTFHQRINDEAARDVYPHAFDAGIAHDDGKQEDEPIRPRPTH